VACFSEVEGAVESGWTYALLANVARLQGHSDLAKSYLCQNLRTTSIVFGHVTLLFCLMVYVHLVADEGQLERAVELNALLEKYPLIQTSSGIRGIYAWDWTETKTMLSPEVAAEAEARGRARDLQETAAEILAELEEAIRV